MKRFLALLLAALMVFALAACGTPAESQNPGTPGDTDNQGETHSPENSENPNAHNLGVILSQGGLGDLGYNDSAAAGCKTIKEKYGVDYVLTDPKEIAQGETYVRELAEEGYGAIFCLEWSLNDTMRMVAKEYPDQYFIVVGLFDSGEVPENVIIIDSYLGQAQANFLCGVIASFVATDGNTIIDGVAQQTGDPKLGCVFGVESVGFYMASDAFEHGAKFYNPKASVISDYTVGFSDAANGKNVVDNMVSSLGVDVVYCSAGAAGIGGLQACRLNNAFGIGVDSNQDGYEPGYILTSMMKYTDRQVEIIGEMLANDKLTGGMVIDCTIDTGMIGITDMATVKEYVTDPEKFAELEKVVADVKAGLESGEIQPFNDPTSRFADWYAAQTDFVSYEEWAAK